MPAALHDAIVIGAGHNGLVAAFYLARAGLRVLVLERREIVGGCAVTEEIDPQAAPGHRVSTASYMASMLSPRVIADLDLARYGLRMVAADPPVQAVIDGFLVPWWADVERLRAALRRVASAAEVEQFIAFEHDLKRLARFIEPFFMEAPPSFDGALERLKAAARLARRFGAAASADLQALLRFMVGSLGELLEQRLRSEPLRRLVLANSLYGKHGGPYDPGTAFGLLFHLLSGGEHGAQGFQGHVIGGMGAITQAMAQACRAAGVEIRTCAAVSEVQVRAGRCTGVVLEDGTQIAAPLVVSNADPRRTFLSLVPAGALAPEFLDAVRAIRMNGPCAKVNFALAEAPKITGLTSEATPAERAVFTLVPTLAGAQRMYETARAGHIPEELWIDAVVPSQVDSTLAPAGHHVLTCFVQFVPYRLEGGWEAARESFGDQVAAQLACRVPNLPRAVLARRVLTPLDLERTFGITEGNIFHGDLSLEQLFFMRPVPGFARYRSPLPGLYLCGAGTHPGGGVTGAPGYNAARVILGEAPRWRGRKVRGATPAMERIPA